MNPQQIKEQLKNYAPKPIRKLARNSLKAYRDLRNVLVYRSSGKVISETDILNCLRQLGVKEGDTLLVHSSLSRLGFVEGGSQTVYSALLKAVGPAGTLGAPTFWGNTPHYLEGNLVFDVRNSPSILGAITEKIRQHPEAKRSLHPTHSAAFIGPQAEYLVNDHHKDGTPMGVNSPYLKLAQIGGKILLLGVTVEYLTSFHTIEDIIEGFKVNPYLPEPLTFTVIDSCGNEMAIATYCHCPEVANTRQCIKMEPYLKKAGVIKEEKLGSAKVKVLDAPKLHDTLLKLYEKGITMYSP